MTDFPASDLIDRAGRAGFKLTSAGRQALADATAETITAIQKALDEGVTFDQFTTEKWDGEACFEEISR